MPINYEQLKPQIQKAGEKIGFQTKECRNQENNAFEKIGLLAGELDLAERLKKILTGKTDQRCAIPGTQLINDSFPLETVPAVSVNILAADGSQINPDRHDEISFGLINTAVFVYRSHSSENPRIITETTLLNPEDFELRDTYLNEDQIALKRDVAEREMLAREACLIGNESPVIALTDGPLELFNLRQSLKEQKPLIDQYEASLEQLAAAGVIAAGYIDRPQADLVIRMLDLLLQLPDENQTSRHSYFPLVCDSDLFSLVLKPGERSAIFELNSKSNREMNDRTKLSFFYLNTGRENEPVIIRVEIPAWVAGDEKAVKLLHACLMEQNRILGTKPYPYVLHRAHECAVVPLQEKERIKDLLLRELVAQGERISGKSNKQTMKDISGKKISIR
jgi:hypothetical protein